MASSNDCRYKRYPEFYKVMVALSSDPWKGECGFITTTSANNQQLEAANKDPKRTCINCEKNLVFVYE